jgi:DNA-binding response OmpR family regulator
MELIARIKAVFRRQKLERDFLQQENTIQKPFDYGYFTLDPLQASLTVKGLNIECTAKELELLAFFCRNPNRIYTVTQLYDAVWGTLQDGLEKTVVIHISKLRKKLLDEEKPSRIIVNMRGIGYKFIPPDHG